MILKNELSISKLQLEESDTEIKSLKKQLNDAVISEDELVKQTTAHLETIDALRLEIANLQKQNNDISAQKSNQSVHSNENGDANTQNKSIGKPPIKKLMDNKNDDFNSNIDFSSSSQNKDVPSETSAKDIISTEIKPDMEPIMMIKSDKQPEDGDDDELSTPFKKLIKDHDIETESTKRIKTVSLSLLKYL